MKKFEKADNNYIKNMRNSIEKVQMAIRRTDTIFNKGNLSEMDTEH